jgi:hypothetical protein
MNAKTIDTVKKVLTAMAPLFVEIAVIILSEIHENSKNQSGSGAKPSDG